MPELPEVETVCRGLAQSLVGRRMAGIDQNRKDLRTPIPRDLSKRLGGKKVTAITRRAKYIQMFFDDGQVLLLHLGMSGRMVVGPKPAKPGKHDHLVFHVEGGVSVTFNDPRRFGACDLTNEKDLPHHKWLKHLGVEPLAKDFTPVFLKEKFKGKTANVKTALMDQRLVVGIGNIYASESLFHAGISPKRKAGSVTAAQLEKLVPSVRKVLNAAIAAGGSSLRDYRRADGELGYFQHSFAVYGRPGEACPGCDCDRAKTGGIRRIAQAGRSTFYCKTRQL